METPMSGMDEACPVLSDPVSATPVVRGVADLTTFAYQGNDYDSLIERIGHAGDPCARRFDTAIAAQLAFRRSQGLNLQDEGAGNLPALPRRPHRAPHLVTPLATPCACWPSWDRAT